MIAEPQVQVVVDGDVKRLLAPSDLRFLGFERFATQGFGALTGSFNSGIGRRANGHYLMFGMSTTYPLLEYALPDAEPSPVLATAPKARFIRSWGNVRAGMFPSGMATLPAGIYVDEHDCAWITCRSTYTQNNEPTVICVRFNDVTGVPHVTGPWRSDAGAIKACSSLMRIPDHFADAYLEGKHVADISSSVSGAKHSAGPSLTPMRFPNPDAPADPVRAVGTTASIRAKSVIWHDSMEPLPHGKFANRAQPTTARYKTCKAVGTAADKYDCSAGAIVSPGLPIWGSQSPSIGTPDTMTGACWVDFPDVRGVIYFGQLVDTPKGYRAPNDPDGWTHRGYAKLGNDADGTPVCCHGQKDWFFSATGPFAHTRVRKGWIYDEDRFIPLARGASAPWSLLAADSEFELADLIPDLPIVGPTTGRGFGYGAVVDNERRQIRIPFLQFDATQSALKRPCTLVLGVH